MSANLHHVEKVILIRVNNGWIVRDQKLGDFRPDSDCFVFETTESLQKNLVRLLGHSGWKIETPPRDEKGHFVKANPAKEVA